MAAERVANGLAANPTVFLRTKVQKELGLSPDVGGAALGDALTVGLTYMGAAVIPLWPYVALPLMAPALVTSLVCTLVALFALGVAKGRIARQAWQRAGVQVMLIGSASAAVGFAIGPHRDLNYGLNYIILGALSERSDHGREGLLQRDSGEGKKRETAGRPPGPRRVPHVFPTRPTHPHRTRSNHTSRPDSNRKIPANKQLMIRWTLVRVQAGP